MSYSATPTWPIPDPAAIYSKAAAVYETTPALAGIDARSSFSVASANCRIVAMTAYDLYLMQANLAQELMPDTARIWLSRHGGIWGVPQLQPAAATGFAVFAGTPTKPVPSGTLMTAPGGALYMTTAAGTIGGGGTVSIPIVSALGGSAYNLAGGTTLQLVSALAGISPQSATLDSNGATGGTDLETNDAWRARILARIRQAPNGGSVSDYYQWAKDAGAAYVNVVPGAVGAGSVGIYIAAAGPTAAGGGLVTAVQNYVGVYNGTPNGVRPATARALVYAATLVPQNVTLSLNPDTALTRAAATAALVLFFQQSAQIGATLYMSRLDNAVSDADGEFSHERTVPSADVTCTLSQIITLGTVTFV